MGKKALLFRDTGTYNKIMAETDPATCKAFGKSAANFDQDLWDCCKEEIIYNANYAKFSQNPEKENNTQNSGGDAHGIQRTGEKL
jgi:predicted NAD-dependent protein-ADP-ribosyltransferase YbiA (DUF1768 family)